MLNSVSETAIYTLMSRVKSYEESDGLIDDPIGQALLNSLLPKLPTDQLDRVSRHRVPDSLKYYVVLRALKYDDQVRTFLKTYPDGLVVSLGSGLDTRYWRTCLEPGQYIELDLPEMVGLKENVYGRPLP